MFLELLLLCLVLFLCIPATKSACIHRISLLCRPLFFLLFVSLASTWLDNGEGDCQTKCFLWFKNKTRAASNLVNQVILKIWVTIKHEQSLIHFYFHAHNAHTRILKMNYKNICIQNFCIFCSSWHCDISIYFGATV